MADVILTAAGQVAGAAIGGPIGAAIGGAIGGAIGRTFTPTQKAQGPRLGDLRVTGTEYGQPIPWVAGSPRISGQIIWASPKREIANTQKQGKGGGGGSEVTTFTYEVDVAYLLTENEIDGVGRIWSNGELVYDGVARGGVWAGIAIYLGTDDQMPDPTIEAAVGVDNTPAYRGRGYVVIRSLQLGGSGQLPNLTFEISTSGSVIYPKTFYFRAPYDIENQFADNVLPLAPSNTRFTGTGALSITNEGAFLTGNAVASIEYSSSNKLRFTNAEYSNLRIVQDVQIIGITEALPAVAGYRAIMSFEGGSGNAEFWVGRPTISDEAQLFYRPPGVGGIPTISFGAIDSFVGKRIGLVSEASSNTVTPSLDGVAIVGAPTFLRTTSFTFWSVGFGINASGSNPLSGIAFKDAAMFSQEAPDIINVELQSIGLPVGADRLLSRAGYALGQFDVSNLSDDDRIRGLALSQVANTRSALELLQTAYFFEAAKTDRIKLFPRQSTAVATIPYADLGFSFDGGDQEQLVLTNSNDLELPAQISVQYANMLADYQAGAEFSDRLLTEQESTSVVQLALGLLPVEAKTIADKLLSDLIAGQWRFTIKLPLKYAYLMPGDIFNVVARDGRSFRGRVQQKKDSQVLIELECVLDDVGTLDVDAATDANYVSQTVRQVADTEWETLDIPILRDADNNVSYYSALTPVAFNDTQWPGGVIVQSFGGAFDQVYTTGDRSAIGECDTVLGDWVHGAMFDETNSLTVTLYAGELESVARSDMLLDQELNAAAVGADGRWEIIRFRNAELTGQTSSGLNIYRLSGLLRGQRGTEWAIASHEVDDRFVLLDSTIRVVNSQTNELNIEREIKGVTFNFLLDDVTGRMFTHTGVGLKPFSVAQLRALAVGSDVEVTWNWRTRLSYRYGGVAPVVPFGEAAQLYRVWIYDGSTLVRTENVTTNSYTYTAANIAADGFASSDTIRIEVAQVSAIVGAGYIEEVEVIAP